MIDFYGKAEEAAKQLKDYLSGIFGDLGNNMSDALVDAFKNGTDAGKRLETASARCWRISESR